MMIKNLALVSFSLFASAIANAQPWVLSPTVSLQAGQWQGENITQAEEYATQGSQFAIGLKLHRGNFYSGIQLGGGEYEFTTAEAPRLPDQTVSATDPTTVKRAEFDLLAGYYFWQHVSLFVNLKGSSSEWTEDNVKVGYTGLGFGIQAFLPYNQQWSFYGSFGVAPDLTITQAATSGQPEQQLGSGAGVALQLGATMRLPHEMALSIGVKSQSQTLTYDSGFEQRTQIGGLLVAFSKSFDL